MFFNEVISWFYRESRSSWDQEIRDDVIEECNKHGGVLHLYVDKASPQGNVYVKCPTISAAVASVRALHGRYFGGNVKFCYFHLWKGKGMGMVNR